MSQDFKEYNEDVSNALWRDSNNGEIEQLRQRVAELEKERDYFENQFELAKVAHVDCCEKLTAERDQMNIYCAQAERLAGEAAEERDTLKQQRDELVALVVEARTTLEMWKDVAPAVSLCADMDAAIASVKEKA